ncbi:MAG: hypothetical protein FWF56_00210 [Firmicutes bacterium]|nr:hypothetical protein [Bacillota bacterium]MCL1953986.1 hypothetical protein [Bacillota bacterium]
MDKLTILFAIILPIIIVQFGLALVSLMRLAYCGYNNKKYATYNILSVLGLIVGPIFVIYLSNNDYKLGKKKQLDSKLSSKTE